MSYLALLQSIIIHHKTDAASLHQEGFSLHIWVNCLDGGAH